MTDEELIAAHLAKKAITRVETGASNNITGGMWYKASQGQVDLNEKLANGPLAPKAKRVAKPAREGEVFFHSAFKRSN
jgi:hypothetical protein